MTSDVTADLPQALSGAHARARRYQASTAPAPTRLITAAATRAMRCGAAKMAMPVSQALPRPRPPSSTGIAQHDAAPKAAASPPTASRSAPASFAVSRTAGWSRISSVIFDNLSRSIADALSIYACRQANQDHDAERTGGQRRSADTRIHETLGDYAVIQVTQQGCAAFWCHLSCG